MDIIIRLVPNKRKKYSIINFRLMKNSGDGSEVDSLSSAQETQITIICFGTDSDRIIRF